MKPKRTPAELAESYREKAIAATARADKAATRPAKARVRRTPEEMATYWTEKAEEVEARANVNPLDSQILRIGRKAKKLQEDLMAADNYCPEVLARLGDVVQAIEETM